MKVKLLSGVRLLATPWTAAHQAPPPMGFSRQEYWSGVPLPSPSGAERDNAYENMIAHLQETWKIQNKITYSSTIYYNF